MKGQHRHFDYTLANWSITLSFAMVANALTSLATKYTLLHYSEPSVIITNFIRQTTQSKNAYNHQRRKKVKKIHSLGSKCLSCERWSGRFLSWKFHLPHHVKEKLPSGKQQTNIAVEHLALYHILECFLFLQDKKCFLFARHSVSSMSHCSTRLHRAESLECTGCFALSKWCKTVGQIHVLPCELDWTSRNNPSQFYDYLVPREKLPLTPSDWRKYTLYSSRQCQPAPWQLCMVSDWWGLVQTS